MEINDIILLSDLIDKVNPKNRCYELNLHAFSKHGTIEIRRFAGTTEEPQIYASIAMIASMAKEARTRTHHIFDEQIKVNTAKEIKADAKDKLATHYGDHDDLPLSFVNREHTERQRELFMLRVKPIHENPLIIITPEEAIALKASIERQVEATEQKRFRQYLRPMILSVLAAGIDLDALEYICTPLGIEYQVLGLDNQRVDRYLKISLIRHVAFDQILIKI
jgi:hypothetical protein